jgi:SAM-dependent methyltransferase
MLCEARSRLAELGRAFVFEQFDATSIPHPESSFDAIIANHMLYHVDDRPRALREIRRVLKPSGKLYAGTNGRKHLVQLDEIVARFFPGISPTDHVERFGLETGYEQLARWFGNVEVRRYEDGLAVTEAQPLVDYVLSMSALLNTDADRVAALRTFVQAELDRRGVIEISKDAGLFIASVN